MNACHRTSRNHRCQAPRECSLRHPRPHRVADEVIQQGHKILPLNIGDPLNFDFQTPPHIIEAAYKAMRDGKNGYAPSPGIPEALEAIRGDAARKGITTVRDVFVTAGVSETVDLCLSALVDADEEMFLRPSPITRCIRPCYASWASHSMLMT